MPGPAPSLLRNWAPGEKKGRLLLIDPRRACLKAVVSSAAQVCTEVVFISAGRGTVRYPGYDRLMEGVWLSVFEISPGIARRESAHRAASCSGSIRAPSGRTGVQRFRPNSCLGKAAVPAETPIVTIGMHALCQVPLYLARVSVTGGFVLA